jgi:hypothetical protein
MLVLVLWQAARGLRPKIRWLRRSGRQVAGFAKSSGGETLAASRRCL